MIRLGDIEISDTLLADLSLLCAPHQRDEDAKPFAEPQYEWEEHFRSDFSAPSGYDGILFSTNIDGTPTYVISHLGSNDGRDVPSLHAIARQKTPPQLKAANAFTDKVYDYVTERHPNEKADILHVGHSLGGALAVLLGNKHIPSIAFEAPGVEGILRHQRKSIQATEDYVLEVLSPHATLINSYGSHVGNVMTPGEKEDTSDRYTVADFLSLTVRAHQLDHIHEAIASGNYTPPVPAHVINRPNTIFQAYREFVSDCCNSSIKAKASRWTNNILMATRLDRGITGSFIAAWNYFPDLFANMLTGTSIEGELPELQEAIERELKDLQAENDNAVLMEKETASESAEHDTARSFVQALACERKLSASEPAHER